MNTALTAATNLVLAVLGVVTGSVLARLLGPHGRGELAAIQTWPTLMGYLVMLGSDAAVIYFVAREPEAAARYTGSAALIGLSFSLPCAIVMYLAMPILLSAQSRAVITDARYYLAIIPVITLHTLGSFVLRGRRDFNAWNVMRVLPTFLWLLIVFLAWAMTRGQPGFLAAANFAAMALAFIPLALVVRRRVPGSFLPDRDKLRPMLAYGLPCLMTSIPMILNLRMDQMLMAGLLPPVQLGLYVAAVAWAGALNPLLNAVAFVSFPEVAAKIGGPEQMKLFARTTRFAVLGAVSVAFGLMFITRWGILLLFGRGFLGAIPAALILIPAGAIAGVNLVIEQGLLGLGKPGLVMRSEMAGLVTTGVSLALMLRPFGIVGAAVASVLGYATVSASLLYHVYRVSGASAVELLVPSINDIRAYLTQARLLLGPVRGMLRP